MTDPFRVHSIAGWGPFPVAAGLALRDDGRYALSLMPCSAAMLVDGLAGAVGPYAVVWGVAAYDFVGDAGVFASTADAVRSCGLDVPDVVDAVAASMDELRLLVTELAQHDLSVVDAPVRLGAEALLDVYEGVATALAEGRSPLDALPGARVHAHVHDDCYVQLVARDRRACWGVVAHALSRLVRLRFDLDVPRPDDGVVEALMDAGAFTLVQTGGRRDGDRVTLPVARRAFDRGTSAEAYLAATDLSLEATAAGWRIR